MAVLEAHAQRLRLLSVEHSHCVGVHKAVARRPCGADDLVHSYLKQDRANLQAMAGEIKLMFKQHGRHEWERYGYWGKADVYHVSEHKLARITEVKS